MKDPLAVQRCIAKPGEYCIEIPKPDPRKWRRPYELERILIDLNTQPDALSKQAKETGAHLASNQKSSRRNQQKCAHRDRRALRRNPLLNENSAKAAERQQAKRSA